MTMTSGTVRLLLRSFNRKVLDKALTKILELVNVADPNAVGVVTLPSRIRKFSVLRSPNGDKDSQEQFEIRTHKRLVEFKPLKAKTLELLMRIELPAEVDVIVKT